MTIGRPGSTLDVGRVYGATTTIRPQGGLKLMWLPADQFRRSRGPKELGEPYEPVEVVTHSHRDLDAH